MSTLKSYYQLTADEIYEDVKSSHENTKHFVEDVGFVVFPHVYPSHKFRTTGFVLRNLKDLVKGKTICDMGCGPGVVGLYALKNGAKKVVQADINSYAIENAKENNKMNGFKRSQIESYVSDCFDNVPLQMFDLIIFNMPYHRDDIEIADPLQRAFYDPNFNSIKKFLSQSETFVHEGTQIFIAFSNKGDTAGLESAFEKSNFQWELWKTINSEEQFDNRIYLLQL
ncbi:hypothetical protein COB11_07785 [Candidatus Aerophobetes bacterium]|uniref:Methyltransferase small domain-containing protein n=1 Tax=Aerophobetes bacterium TaxID=2030807 RepID=A0A2A4YCS6_UNCAE|nr:MAG: hypothetical protein COB11_07785 [Candidatus Aerophobetes bacterium]